MLIFKLWCRIPVYIMMSGLVLCPRSVVNQDISPQVAYILLGVEAPGK